MYPDQKPEHRRSMTIDQDVLDEGKIEPPGAALG
jgi:hypothetical protein